MPYAVALVQIEAGMLNGDQSFAIVLWGWLQSHVDGDKMGMGKLFPIEEVGKLLYGKQQSASCHVLLLTMTPSPGQPQGTRHLSFVDRRVSAVLDKPY